jgi:hypothetical protein
MTSPLVYNVQNKNEKRKQYGISFEVTTFSQTKLQFQNFAQAFCF